MSLLSYNELVKLVESGVIDAPMENINGASIDITLGDEFMEEIKIYDRKAYVHIADGESIAFRKVRVRDCTYGLEPGQFVLATSRETFNIPNYIACEYKLKSTLARNGLNHMLAGWCDPGWNNSKLTLELSNMTQHHVISLRPGMKIGQMIFFRCAPVSYHDSYRVKGQYNGQTTVTQGGVLK